jgi:N-acetylmuramoyl-L-alanine amidase
LQRRCDITSVTIQQAFTSIAGKHDRPRDQDSWIQARVIAAELLVDPPPDPTGRALFYHSTKIGVPWKRRRIRTIRIGNHIFYR